MSRYKTPLRYPGGKQRLAPFITEIIEANRMEGCVYVEPYAGGAGVAIELLLENRVRQIHLNDSSLPIFAFWKSILSEPEAFCRRIARVPLTLAQWKKQREVSRHPEDHDLFSLGFSTFYLNRCNRSGVLTGGVIGGLSQEGRWKIDARFNRKQLIARVEAIAFYADKISISNMDAEELIMRSTEAFPKDTLFYCDPPYYQRSQRLYLDSYKEEDHERLSKTIQRKLKHRWVVSYDGHAELLDLYARRKKFLYSLQYSAVQVYKGTEVFIFSDNTRIPRDSRIPFIADGLKSAFNA